MQTGMATHLLRSFIRLVRACAIMVGLGLVMLSSNHCPTGQTDCSMAGMDMETQDGVCVLACGIPFQYSVQATPAFVGKISVLPVPKVPRIAGILTEPDVPPPRSLV
ncbi:MAG: hypothetical protein A2092_06015 [Rhodobacteraceae bacterium GWE1_64_9]|nr:MAG: hypothetical protein A2092_06015 [Rhodobacteraceae bacterium GWE1_64_9]OHC47838.1 MAG: hypothetical protein A2X69_15645 [Rhodobacteraceae bacterium GWF1_65_7]